MSTKNTRFSVKNRQEFIQSATTTEVDLLVIGGGITGAGIALDAAQRGLKVVLLEKNDYAWGTSSRSTKLIHGGLRYLKQFEFKLVKEVGRERAIVQRNAQHLVLPEKMLLPLYKNGSLSKLGASVGLYVYDFLAGVKRGEHRRMLDKEGTKKAEPLLQVKALVGSGLYFEYRTDDARLTIEIVKKSVELGAICLNQAEVSELLYENGKIIGVTAQDHIGKEEFVVKAKTVVNASGPWVDLLRKEDKSLNTKRLQLTKGVHIVVPFNKLPIKQSVYFDVKDGRMIFAIPRGGKTYIGTTDTVYNQIIDNPTTTMEDVRYLVKAVKKTFPSSNLSISNVESTWAGLRPLIYEDGKSPSELSRKDEIFDSETGLISIAGGKLTGYRKMAERTVNRVAKRLEKLGVSSAKCATADLKVSGGAFKTTQAVMDYVIQLTGESKQINLTVNHIKDWVYKFGSNSGEVLEIAYNLYANKIRDPDLLALLSEVKYTIDNEQVTSLRDFYIRRTGMLYFKRPSIKLYLDEVAQFMSNELNWSASELELQKKHFDEDFRQVLSFKESEKPV